MLRLLHHLGRDLNGNRDARSHNLVGFRAEWHAKVRLSTTVHAATDCSDSNIRSPYISSPCKTWTGHAEKLCGHTRQQNNLTLRSNDWYMFQYQVYGICGICYNTHSEFMSG